ncbi:MAG: hypothetical protein K2Y40_10355 [Reyranella sp.]|jgi:hypothetical protein|nr:hypothetical protein [Reyranella sp.]
MKIESTETLASMSVSATASLAMKQRRWLGVIRAIAYWGLWCFLVISVFAGAGDIWGYYSDPTTYHQVYRDAVLHDRVAWAYFVLATIAIPFQAAGWKKRRFSVVAVAVFALHVCFAVADQVFGIILICCT